MMADEEGTDFDCLGSASSDISLATTTSMTTDEEAYEDDDILMSSAVEVEVPSLASSDLLDSDDEIDIDDMGSSICSDESVYDADNDNDNGIDMAGSDSDDTAMEHADSLSVTVVMTNTGSITMEIGGSVPLQKAGHLTIMSRLERSLPVTFVTSMLLLANPLFLKELTLSQVALSGNDREFEAFTMAIRFLCDLEELHLIDCCLLNDNGTRPLDTILYGISSSQDVLPKLHHLELYAVDIDREPVGSFLGPAALAHLVRNKTSLIKLSLEDLTLDDDHIVELAQALEINKTLKYLKLWGCAVLDRGVTALAHMMEKNTAVEQLDLSYNEIGNVGCVSLAKSLHVTKTLKALKLVRNESILAGGKGYEALLEMMKWNHNIEELLLQPSQETDSDLGFYLFVNRHRYLLENDNISKSQLVDMMHSHRSDTTFLFHFLKAKPALCNT